MDAVIVSVVTGLISSVATISAIKVDIVWIKLIQKEQKADVEELEKRLISLERKVS